MVIVGGGLSGLAAAASLAGRGLEITLLESRPRLGGRAGSFTDPATGELVDNCQHVSMACCTNLADFCRKVGTGALFRKVPEVVFLSETGRASRLKAGPWPAPFHLAGSFLRANYLTVVERLRVAFGLMCLRFDRSGRPGEPFSAWLLRHGQTPRTVDRYWGIVLVSALNERLEQMDLGHARKVFLDGFLRNREGFVMEVPLVPLGELYGTRLESWLAENDVGVRLTTGARSVEVDDEGAVAGVLLRNGERIDADFVVLAAPFDRARGFFSAEALAKLPSLAGLDEMHASPITGVHLWFDRPVCPLEHAVTVGRTVQWVFNHTALQGREAPDGGGQYLQLVISAAYDLVGKTREQILEIALADLSGLWPEAKQAKLLRWWVVTEHGATFAVRPGVDRDPPPPEDADRGPVPLGRLDGHRLARHDGRGRPRRLPRGRRRPGRPREPRGPPPRRPPRRPPGPPPARPRGVPPAPGVPEAGPGRGWPTARCSPGQWAVGFRGHRGTQLRPRRGARPVPTKSLRGVNPYSACRITSAHKSLVVSLGRPSPTDGHEPTGRGSLARGSRVETDHSRSHPSVGKSATCCRDRCSTSS